MRKKSHISLARYIVANTEDEGLKKHWLSFYIGSVLPDCKPSFIYKRHEITGTFPKLRKDIDALIHGKEKRFPKRKRMYYMNLGEITHYVAVILPFRTIRYTREDLKNTVLMKNISNMNSALF